MNPDPQVNSSFFRQRIVKLPRSLLDLVGAFHRAKRTRKVDQERVTYEVLDWDVVNGWVDQYGIPAK